MYSSMKCGVMKLLNNCLESFINCVRLRTKPVVSGQDGLNAIELVEKIRVSMKLSAEKFGENSPELLRVFNQ